MYIYSRPMLQSYDCVMCMIEIWLWSRHVLVSVWDTVSERVIDWLSGLMSVRCQLLLLWSPSIAGVTSGTFRQYWVDWHSICRWLHPSPTVTSIETSTVAQLELASVCACTCSHCNWHGCSKFTYFSFLSYSPWLQANSKCTQSSPVRWASVA